MYARFLTESARITKNDRLAASAEKIQRSGELFTEIGVMFKEAEKVKDINARITKASELFDAIADIEEDAFTELSTHIK
jgi:hypothetical protein